MKKILVLLTSLIATMAFAHVPSVDYKDLENGKFLIQCADTERCEGVNIYLLKDKPYDGDEESYEGKMVIFHEKMDSSNKLEVVKPKTSKYVIVFDMGPGHIFYKPGFKLSEKELSSWETLVNNVNPEYKNKMLEK